MTEQNTIDKTQAGAQDATPVSTPVAVEQSTPVSNQTGVPVTNSVTTSLSAALDADTLKELQELVQYTKQRKAEEQLKQVWGDAYEDTFQSVKEYLSALPPELATPFNNVEGALVLANLLGGLPLPSLEQDSVPATAAISTKKVFSAKELDQLYKTDRAEYWKLKPEIDLAYQEGRVTD